MRPKKTKMRRLINYIPVYSTFRDTEEKHIRRQVREKRFYECPCYYS